MRSIMPAILALFIFFSRAEAQRNCGTDAYFQIRLLKDPRLNEKLERHESRLQDMIKENRKTGLRTSVTIPVVVHVVYKTDQQNISDEQILSQIDVLNRDFKRLNPDTSETPAAFAGVAANCEIQFCLAQRDPEGNATSGIDRVETTKSSFTVDDQVKHASDGGADAWDVTRYFNIWVCNLSAGLLGYGAFPGWGIDENYGLVVGYKYFGTTGTVDPPFDEGRTATHEMGHCLDLYHIWGNNVTASCNDDDLVDDTPDQFDENYGCPAFPHISCTNGPDGDMFMNYMDYTNDGCMNLFTEGQKERMHAAIDEDLQDLLVSDACIPIPEIDASVFQFGPIDVCGATFTPEVPLKNLGLNTLTSCDIYYSLDGGSSSTYNWTGNLEQGEMEWVTLGPLAITPGTHTLNATTGNPNGGADGYTSNDSYDAEVVVVTEGVDLPVTQEFGSAAFPPADWIVQNSDGDLTWSYKSVGYTFTGSAYMRNYNYESRGEIDDLIMPHLDLTTLDHPTLTFYVAYQLYTNPNAATKHSDTLEVLLSDDCGVTWHVLYKKFSTDLVTVTPSYSTVEFVPNESSDWRMETIDLSSYSDATNAIVRFRCINDYENNLYIDKVNITEPVGLNEVNTGMIRLYPNPADAFVTVHPDPSGDGEMTVQLTDASGKLLMTESSNTRFPMVLDVALLPPGSYFITVISPNEIRVEKVVIAR